MALKKNIIFNDIPVTDAYIRASMYQVLPPGNSRMTFTVSVMAGPTSAPVKASEFSCDFDLFNSNFNIAEQAYEYLKTLPEFADATDC